MKKNELDLEMMLSLTELIKDRIMLIMKVFPKSDDYEFLLKHLAAASIHMCFFARDLFDFTEGIPIKESDDNEKMFLEECGCKDEKEK